MIKLLQIVNYKNFHYEIIESIIVKYHIILNIEKNTPMKIYLAILDNASFKKYINDKYPKIQFKLIQNFDYYINCTIYDKDFDNLDYKQNSVKKYISHEITDKLITNPNVFYLTPLSKKNFIYTDILPYANTKTKTPFPIYIIQGNLNHQRRYLNLLKKILDHSYRYKFIIKLIGKGFLPDELNGYKDKIIVKKNLNFIDFHKEFIDGYCILPLISKKTHPHYYHNKLTSTINYARGYNLKCLIDKDLQNIYNLKNVEIYNDINDITHYFSKTLEQFYNKT